MPEHLIIPQINNAGYKVVHLNYNGKIRNTSIHRLVAETFISNRYNLSVVNHKDENKLNNNVSNLEWCTQKYNMNYGTLQNRIRQSMKKQQKVITLKPINKKKIVINEIKFITECDAAFYFGLTPARISQLLRKPTKKYNAKIIYEIEYIEVKLTKKYAEKRNYEIVKEII